jgi:hypothetical protein
MHTFEQLELDLAMLGSKFLPAALCFAANGGLLCCWGWPWLWLDQSFLELAMLLLDTWPAPLGVLVLLLLECFPCSSWRLALHLLDAWPAPLGVLVLLLLECLLCSWWFKVTMFLLMGLVSVCVWDLWDGSCVPVLLGCGIQHWTAFGLLEKQSVCSTPNSYTGFSFLLCRQHIWDTPSGVCVCCQLACMHTRWTKIFSLMTRLKISMMVVMFINSTSFILTATWHSLLFSVFIMQVSG